MGRLFGKKADKTRSRGEILCELQERCVGAQGICMVGFAVFFLLLIGTCRQGIIGEKPFLDCVNDGLFQVLWMILCLVGARFFSRAGKEGGPFRPGRARELKVISKLAIASSFVPGLFAWLLWYVLHVFAPESGLIQDTVEFGQIINFPMLYAGFVISALALIISYGCVLQQQDDGLV